jgi:anionic cell wall polymer biosynthesis LytR-Cps2A-Psr (LCP) family protein
VQQWTAWRVGGGVSRRPRIPRDTVGARTGAGPLYLSRGVHHLSGTQALVLARTRENKCNPTEIDLTPEMRQQQIFNVIKAKLECPSTFFRLPWAS